MHSTENENLDKRCAMLEAEVSFLSHKILDLNKQLIESEKAKSRFLSLIANELNNPITALLGLVPHLVCDNDKQPMCDLVQEELLTLNFRIQNLVAASEIENGEVSISHSSLNITDLIDEARKALRYLFKNHDTTLRIDDRLGRPIVTDPQKLYLILINILANASMYGTPGSEVTILIEPEETTVRIAITNQGEPPHVNLKPQIFTRFAPGPGAHGLGVGLSIVRELSERLDGSTDYDSDEKSVRFIVRLPLIESDGDSEACGSNEFLFDSFDDAIEL